MKGGRAANYVQRHAEGGHARTYAPRWTDAAVDAAAEHLRAGATASTANVMNRETAKVLASPAAVAAFVAKVRNTTTPHDAKVARVVLTHHQRLWARARGVVGKRRVVHACTEQVLRRTRRLQPSRPLEVTAAQEGHASFRELLAEQPQKERLRDITRCQRLLEGVAQWDLRWLQAPGAIVFERARARGEGGRRGRRERRKGERALVVGVQ